MVNRKEDQGQESIEKIKKEVGEDAKIEWTSCDMGSLKNVKEVFTRIRDQEERLDLVNINANKFD
jgi:short-subunit dehydrogenase